MSQGSVQKACPSINKHTQASMIFFQGKQKHTSWKNTVRRYEY